MVSYWAIFFFSPSAFLVLTGRPANPVDRLPVLVFIHGESFDWGSSLLYDGSLLSSYSNLVVVTLNFRLGVLGKECAPDPASTDRSVFCGAWDPQFDLCCPRVSGATECLIYRRRKSIQEFLGKKTTNNNYIAAGWCFSFTRPIKESFCIYIYWSMCPSIWWVQFCCCCSYSSALMLSDLMPHCRTLRLLRSFSSSLFPSICLVYASANSH